MNILITGGAGFIGSAVVRKLIKEYSHNILNIDNLTYAGNLNSLIDIEKSNRYTFKKIDIANYKALHSVFKEFKPDAVMHLAAESHVDKSISGPKKFIDTNIYGTFNLLEISRLYFSELEISKKDNFKLHHISTDEVFGDLDGANGFFNEDSLYKPSSPYSASKASSDHLVRSWCRTFGLPTIITNCSNNYGPYHFPEKLIPSIILKAINGIDIPIYGNGKQVRDWLYVDDHAEALITTLLSDKINITYCIGGDSQMQNIEVVNKILEILSSKGQLNNVDHNNLIKYIDDRPGHDVKYAVDASKIKNELGWKPKENFESGIIKTIDWYLENKDWWQPLINMNSSLNLLGEDA